MLQADQLVEYLPHELAQRREEGYDVSAYERRWASFGLPAVEVHRPIPEEARGAVAKAAPAMEALYRELEALDDRPPAGANEPSDLEAIRALRPAGPRRLQLALSETELRDRILGAWLGRAAGCLLGKPVEGWSRESIRKALEYAGDYPLRQYIAYPFPRGVDPRAADAPEVVKRLAQRPRGWYRGEFDRMVRDDDMDYPLIALHVLEQYGPHFTAADVGRAWQLKLPYLLVYTAERVAYRNLVDGLQPPHTATYRNPYREWIGAQIRADLWGWVCPGQPERAAELAFRDASLSHVKNGIYGEMFFAAAIAASFAVPTVAEALQIGLSEIPADCRLAQAVRQTMRWVHEDGDFQRTTDRIHQAYGHYHRVHTINNAALVVMGLLYAERAHAGHAERLLGDALCLTVMGGWDTDCTGATAGSLVGSAVGAARLPQAWVGSFNDRLESIVIGMTDNRFSDLADRTLAQARALAAA
ncbi:MAG TPA: ADP-ribosylglycohydrolase family protein [Chloroflexota bacterium]|nr:ADP-ribosylglycohydrolase family protein [Chloroflexota bacterium]